MINISKLIFNINLTSNYTVFLDLLRPQTFDWYKSRLKSTGKA